MRLSNISTLLLAIMVGASESPFSAALAFQSVRIAGNNQPSPFKNGPQHRSSSLFFVRNKDRVRSSFRLQDSFLDDGTIILNTKLPNIAFSKSISSSNNNNSNSSTSLGSSSASHRHRDLIEYSSRRVNNRHSANDWLHNIQSIPKSTVLKDIRNPLICVSAWSTLISIIHTLLSKSSYPHLVNFASKMYIGTQMHSLMISSLGLLLVFRTNSAYQRFVEGRKIWEQILSVSRNLDRMISLYKTEIGDAKTSRIKHYLASFPYLLRHHIRPRCLGCDDTTPTQYRCRLEELPYDIVETRHEGDKTHGGIIPDSDDSTSDPTKISSEELLFGKPHYCWVDKRNLPWRLLDDKALQRCTNAINRPLWACNSIADELVTIPYGPNFTSRERLTMISQVDKLSNAIGQCERIHQTAVPLNYARHSLRSLSLWLFTLPFALVKDLGLLTGPICGITAWLMFGVYQIGHSIEDPFQKTLRLSILCNAIRRDVLGQNQYMTSSTISDIGAVVEDEDERRTRTPSAEMTTQLTELILPISSNESTTMGSILLDSIVGGSSNIVEPIHLQ